MKTIAIFGNEKNYKKMLSRFIKDKKKVSFIFLNLELKKLPKILDDVDAVIFFPRRLINKDFLLIKILNNVCNKETNDIKIKFTKSAIGKGKILIKIDG